jgi:ferredoxin
MRPKEGLQRLKWRVDGGGSVWKVRRSEAMAQKFSVWIEDSGESVLCDPRDNVLRAMEALGRRGIPVGCRGGGCGVCKVQVLEGSYHTRKMSRACISEDEETRGVVLACKLFPEADLRLKVLGKMVAALQAPVARSREG